MANDNQLIPIEEKGEIVLYQPDDNVRLEVRLQDDTVWLTQQQMAELFGTQRQAVTKHLKNIYDSEELSKNATSSILELVRQEGGRQVRRKIEFYNLDAIISVGFRINTRRGIMFRQWANAVLKDYLLRGYAVHQQVMALQQINLRIDAQNDRIARIEGALDQQQQQLDFVVRANEKPEELLIPTGCVWDAYMFVCDLIRSAEKRIVLVDNFVDERVLTMLDKRNKSVSAEVHTRYYEQTKLDFDKHNQQYEPINYVQLPHAVHDRYLIVDDSVWLLGTSVKDMGRSLCTIIKVGFAPEMVLGLLK